MAQASPRPTKARAEPSIQGGPAAVERLQGQADQRGRVGVGQGVVVAEAAGRSAGRRPGAGAARPGGRRPRGCRRRRARPRRRRRRRTGCRSGSGGRRRRPPGGRACRRACRPSTAGSSIRMSAPGIWPIRAKGRRTRTIRPGSGPGPPDPDRELAVDPERPPILLADRHRRPLGLRTPMPVRRPTGWSSSSMSAITRANSARSEGWSCSGLRPAAAALATAPAASASRPAAR